MQKSKIEWLRDPAGNPGHSVNPIKGICKMGCDYCYAIKQYKRFKWNPEVRLDMHAFDGIEKIQPAKNAWGSPPKIFVCSTHDLFGKWVQPEWIRAIIAKAYENPHLTFIFLTKNPQNAYLYFFPKNVWLGVSVESQEQVWRIKTLLQPDIKASMKFVSFEPLQGQIDCDFVNPITRDHISWMILGQETGNRKDKIKPEHDWIMHLMWQHADTPVFLKNNLKSQPGCYYGDLYQDFPRTE